MKKVFLLLPVFMFFLTACQESLEKRVQRTWKEYTEKNCPQVITPTITMDSCRFEIETHNLHFYYRFLGAMDNDSIEMKGDAMRKLLLEALRNETSLRVYKEAGYDFTYSYYSDNEPGRLRYEATFTKEDYR